MGRPASGTGGSCGRQHSTPQVHARGLPLAATLQLTRQVVHRGARQPVGNEGRGSGRDPAAAGVGQHEIA